MSQMYDWGQLYGQADMTAGQVIDAGNYDAVVEHAEYGMTNDGSKGQWTVRFRITTGPHAGAPLTTNMTISPVKNDGTSNAAGLGIMFRELGVLGVPVPPNQPFWALGWSPEQVAQTMIGKTALIRVVKDEEYNNNKIRGIRPPRPGAPADWQSAQAANAQQQAQAPAQPGGYAPQGAPYGQSQFAPQGYGQPQGGMSEFTPQGQSAQPWAQPQAQPGYGQPPAPAPGQPSPWNQAPAGPTQPAPGGVPGNQASGYAPPATAGGQNAQYGAPAQQGYAQGYGQTAPGQQAPAPGYGQQPGFPPAGQAGQPPQAGYGAPAQGAPAPSVPYQQGAPSPSSQPQGPAPYGQQQAPDQGGQPGAGPAVPPWAQ